MRLATFRHSFSVTHMNSDEWFDMHSKYSWRGRLVRPKQNKDERLYIRYCVNSYLSEKSE